MFQSLGNAPGGCVRSYRKPRFQNLRPGDAGLIVDAVNDFFPEGAIPVAQGNEIIEPVNDILDEFSEQGLPVFLSRCWHELSTDHFKINGGDWEIHCVQNTYGAEFHPKLRVSQNDIIVSKGIGMGDQFSAFDGIQLETSKTLLELLIEHKVKRLFVGGLATDYCVRQTVLDALKYCFEVVLVLDAVRAVNLKPGNGDRAIEEMRAAGAIIM